MQETASFLQHDERSGDKAHALDAIAAFNDATADKRIEDIAQEHAAKWVVWHCGQSVLDLGYGAGIVTKALMDAGKTVTVVEGSPVVQARIPCGSVLAMFEDFDTFDRFDTVVASHVLEHVDDPVALLKKMRRWADSCVILVPNAKSFHRQLAVLMGLQPSCDTLSDRDRIEGHKRVYTMETLLHDIDKADWQPREGRGFMLKTLPNSMMLGHSEPLLRAMNEIDVSFNVAANIAVCCE